MVISGESIAVAATQESRDVLSISGCLADMERGQVSTQFASTLEEDTPWRKSLRSELAYTYLCGLVYLMACTIGVDMLMTYPSTTDTSQDTTLRTLTGSRGFTLQLLYYLSLIGFDVGILVIASNCFVVIYSSYPKLRDYRHLGHLVFSVLGMIFFRIVSCVPSWTISRCAFLSSSRSLG
jgi:hypothetical protein